MNNASLNLLPVGNNEYILHDTPTNIQSGSQNSIRTNPSLCENIKKKIFNWKTPVFMVLSVIPCCIPYFVVAKTTEVKSFLNMNIDKAVTISGEIYQCYEKDPKQIITVYSDAYWYTGVMLFLVTGLFICYILQDIPPKRKNTDQQPIPLQSLNLESADNENQAVFV